jgi:hypothetical protein
MAYVVLGDFAVDTSGRTNYRKSAARPQKVRTNGSLIRRMDDFRLADLLLSFTDEHDELRTREDVAAWLRAPIG